MIDPRDQPQDTPLIDGVLVSSAPNPVVIFEAVWPGSVRIRFGDESAIVPSGELMWATNAVVTQADAMTKNARPVVPIP